MTLAFFGLALFARAENPSPAYIQRTMKALEASTAEHPARVRVLFYGQSITAQAWTSTIQKQFRDAYPTAAFEFRNAAIGGYTSPALVRTAEHDLYPWYPDLLFFHVYGPMEQYEAIIRETRARTTAEIVLWTSHLGAKEDPQTLLDQPDERTRQILEVARRHRCLGIDLRRQWCQKLLEDGLEPSAFLKDGIHLNDKGCALYAQIVGENLRRVPELGDNPEDAGTITQIPLTDPRVTRDAQGRIALRFTGNRVVAVSDGTGTEGAAAEVLLDGRRPGSFTELWAATRPSRGPHGIWMPAINQVSFDSCPVEEEWTLDCLPGSAPNGSRVRFSVTGSTTGPDGEGNSRERFVSRSGRVAIEPRDWKIAWILNYKKETLPEGFQVAWKTYPLGVDSYEPKPRGERTVLVQGCANGEHVLTLIPEKGDSGIASFIVHALAAPAGSNATGVARRSPSNP